MQAANSAFNSKERSRDEEKEFILVLWEQYCKEFPTAQDSLNDLLKRLQAAEVVKCASCGSTEIDKMRGRLGTCRHCNKKTYLTARTFFERIRNIRAWHAAIWLKERGAKLNSFDLNRLTGIQVSSAWNLLKKLETVIKDHMPENSEFAASASFMQIYGRRSLVTPARAHPREEEEMMQRECYSEENVNDFSEDDACENDSTKNTDGFFPLPKLRELDYQIFEKLSVQPTHCDALVVAVQVPTGDVVSSLGILEAHGLVTALGGSKFVRTTASSNRNWRRLARKENVENQSRVGSVIQFIRDTFQLISRKYIQLYSANHWFYYDKERWKENSLFDACVGAKRVNVNKILRFVSPLKVLV